MSMCSMCRTLRAIALSLGILLLAGCSVLGPGTPVPSGLMSEGGHTWRLWLPPQFGNTAWTQKYPLLISLHGATGSPDTYFAPCIVDNPAEASRYPCVFMAPNSIGGYGREVTWLREAIVDLVRDPAYRIDPARIYIIGFSMGGFGCTQLARDLRQDWGIPVAAVIPSGGGNFRDLPQGAGRVLTASWFHYGLAGDYSQESDYQDAKADLAGALETSTNDLAAEWHWNGTATWYPRTTRTLSQEGRARFLISTYAGMGHSTGPIYRDPKVLDWLFSQTSGPAW